MSFKKNKKITQLLNEDNPDVSNNIINQNKVTGRKDPSISLSDIKPDIFERKGRFVIGTSNGSNNK